MVITSLSELQEAARIKAPSISIVDWVHPYPTLLDGFGPYALGIILCPPLKELHHRLKEAGRLSRWTSSLNDYWQASRESAKYPPRWRVLQSGDAAPNVARRILQLALLADASYPL
jgi:hypothetical protein